VCEGSALTCLRLQAFLGTSFKCLGESQSVYSRKSLKIYDQSTGFLLSFAQRIYYQTTVCFCLFFLEGCTRDTLLREPL
jgi:hypothetical protein